MKTILLTVAAILALPGMTLAHPPSHHQHGASAKAAKKPSLVCPVTGDKIASVKAAVGHSIYKGKTYYFCCAGCKPMFDKAPARYVKNAAASKYAKMHH